MQSVGFFGKIDMIDRNNGGVLRKIGRVVQIAEITFGYGIRRY